MIAENGAILAETERFKFETQMVVADVDVQRLLGERLRSNTYSAAQPVREYRRVAFELPGAERVRGRPLIRPLLSRMPFVPSDPARRAEHCREIFNIQAIGPGEAPAAHREQEGDHRAFGRARFDAGAAGHRAGVRHRRAAAAGDSVDHHARLRHDARGRAATPRNWPNTWASASAPSRSPIRCASISDDIGHDESVHDVTYENAQARERTQILMDVANEIGGFVVGTGDLSELALGWATYNGDHMSMYHVCAGVPKTLVRYLVDWAADEEFRRRGRGRCFTTSARPRSPPNCCR